MQLLLHLLFICLNSVYLHWEFVFFTELLYFEVKPNWAQLPTLTRDFPLFHADFKWTGFKYLLQHEDKWAYSLYPERWFVLMPKIYGNKTLNQFQIHSAVNLWTHFCKDNIPHHVWPCDEYFTACMLDRDVPQRVSKEKISSNNWKFECAAPANDTPAVCFV